MADPKNKEAKPKKQKEPELTFFNAELLEVPQDGSPPYLKGYKCKKCGQLDFPKLSPCPNCWGEEFEMVAFDQAGQIVQRHGHFYRTGRNADPLHLRLYRSA